MPQSAWLKKAMGLLKARPPYEALHHVVISTEGETLSQRRCRIASVPTSFLIRGQQLAVGARCGFLVRYVVIPPAQARAHWGKELHRGG